jgi:hypothetical protein
MAAMLTRASVLLCHNADEEELCGTAKTAGWSDRDNVKIIFCPDDYEGLNGYGAMLLGALWGAKTATLKAASKLTMESHCLRYIPAAIRKLYLDWVDYTVWSESKYLLFSVTA